MALKSAVWNVVVAGSWNRAILTPAGIARRIFQLEEGTPIEVHVPIDSVGVSPFVVLHENIKVMAMPGRLIVEPVVATFANLGRAMQLAKTAMIDLPQTPLAAAGINVHFMEDAPSTATQGVISSEADDTLNERYPILKRTYSRSVQFGEGRLNFSLIREAEGEYAVQFNFEKASRLNTELETWLEQPILDIESAVTWFVQDFLATSVEEPQNVEIE